MKYTYYIFLFIIATIGACSLHEDPLSFITPDEFFLEDRDAQAAVDAIYSHINSGESIYAQYYWLVNAMASDLGTSDGLDPDIAEFANFTLTPQNGIIKFLWRGLYKGINAANYAIENIDSAPLSENEKLFLLAEARFLRAFFYFDLIRFFGEVPLIRETALQLNETVQPEQASMDTLYQFLERELTYAFENLPAASSPGRPSIYTAAAYLGKFYLTTKNYSRAAQASRIILQSGSYNLLTDYASLYKDNSQNNREFIWSVNLNISDGSKINLMILPESLGGRASLLPTEVFFEAFENQDRRRAVTFLTSYPDSQGNPVTIEPHIIKFWDSNIEVILGRSPVDFPLIRYADIMLMHAEALNELRNGTSTEALNVINAVRARARFDGTTAVLNILPDLMQLNKENFAAAILEERKRELGWEGHRWFDLVRFGKLEEKVSQAKPGIQVSNTHYLFPIPADEIALNRLLIQNPGY